MVGSINIECFKDLCNICPTDSPAFLNIWPFMLGSTCNDLKAYSTVEQNHTSFKVFPSPVELEKHCIQ